jgi:hypothetical protein
MTVVVVMMGSFVIGCWLLVVGYWLLVIGYWLLVVGYWAGKPCPYRAIADCSKHW